MESNIRRGRPKGLFQKSKSEPVLQDDVTDVVEEAAPVEVVSSLRPPIRDADPRERARQRAAELREHLGEVVDGTDEFYVDPGIIPEGWTYMWRRHTVYGAEDPAYQVQLARAGWTAVPTSRHPEMMPHDTNSGIITRKGNILMECPTEIIDERKAAEIRKARMQVRAKEEQLSGTPDGTLTRDHAKVRPQINKSYEPMPVPRD